MKIKRAIDRLFSHNEIVALWFDTDAGFKTLLCRGEAWKLSKEYKNLRIARFFGTIPETIWYSDTINILIKCNPIKVGCSTCAKRYTMSCPNSSQCYAKEDKPDWIWNKKIKEKEQK